LYLTQKKKADELWNSLGAYNTKVGQHFRQLSALHAKDPKQYDATIQTCSELPSTEWYTISGEVATEIVALVDDFNHVRSLLQKMSELSDVPVEPKEQTKLLDECLKVPGVAMAGVPGGMLQNKQL
jgi:phosphomevalonate kinase